MKRFAAPLVICLVIIFAILMLTPAGDILARHLELSSQTPVERYVDATFSRNTRFNDNLNQLGQIMVGDDYGSEQVLTSVVSITADMQSIHAELSAIEPPDRYADYHARLLETTESCSTAADKMKTAMLGGQDLVDWWEANRAISDCIEAMKRMRDDRD